MEKTTIYLPAELRRALRRFARERNCSDAEVIRDALSRLVAAHSTPTPRLPLFRATGKSIAHRVDEVLAGGFGRA